MQTRRLFALGLIAIVIVLVLLLAMLAASVLADWLLVPVLGDRGRIFYPLLGLGVLFLVPWNKIGLNRPYDIFASMDIAAPLAQVWDEIDLRPNENPFHATFVRIEALKGVDEGYRYVFAPHLDMPEGYQVQVIERVPCQRLRMVPLNAETMPLFGKDVVASEWTVAALDDATTRVAVRETLSRVSLVALLALMHLNPARDTLETLRARCEGGADTSWMAQQNQKLQDPPSPMGLTSEVAVLGAVAIGFSLLLLVIVIWLVTP